MLVKRRVAVILILVSMLTWLVPSGPQARSVGAQAATPGPAYHQLVGAWIMQELAPPAGGAPVTAGVLTLFADGNALLSGFGDGQPAMQGAWTADGDRDATVTVVGLVINQDGLSDGTLRRLRAFVELNGQDALAGGYTFETIGPAGDVEFTYHGPLGGARVEVEAPDPIALSIRAASPAAGTPSP